MEERRATEGGCLLVGGWLALFQMVHVLRAVVWPHLEKCLCFWIVRRRVSVRTCLQSVKNRNFRVSMSHIQCLFFFSPFFQSSHAYTDFFLPSPFSVLNQDPKVLEILVRDVCVTNCPISQTLMAASGICTFVSVCHPANQTEQITMTGSKVHQTNPLL